MNGLKNYTANDIERYHSGQLSAAEMHAMEKAALDDPFLADALEGYKNTHSPVADLSALHQKLQLRINKNKKRRGVFYLANNWMKVAALFILFAGGGWLVFQTVSKNGQKDTAAIESVKKNFPSVITTTVADSVNDVAIAPENSQTLKMQERVQNKPVATEVATNRPSVEKRQSASAATSLAKKEVKTDESSFKDVTVLEQKYEIDSSRMGRVSLNAKETTAFFNKAADTVKNMDVVLKSIEVAPDEMVVMKNKSTSPQARQRKQIVVDTLEPAEGWTNFDQYLASNLRTPDELKTKPLRGEVELAFDVNKEGEPVNITIIKSLCQKCDEEAIRLLKAGPKWKNSKKKGKLKIKF